ncbi:MAG: hypothetical protein M5U28_38200 [Sandaracinaceae bacterium]|nr:hypothetical protein [Sandaracinaceae bacterium]
MRAITTFGAAATLLATGCVNTFGQSEYELGHDHHEMTSSFDELAAWEQDGDWLVSPALDAPGGASRVGALFGLVAPGEMPIVEARALGAASRSASGRRSARPGARRTTTSPSASSARSATARSSACAWTPRRASS